MIQYESEYLNEISIWWSVQAHWRLYISSRWNFFSSLSLSFHFHLTFIVSVQKLKLAFHLIRTNIVEMISSATQPWFSCTLFGRDRQKLVTIKLIYITHCCVYHTLVTSNNNTVFNMLKLKLNFPFRSALNLVQSDVCKDASLRSKSHLGQLNVPGFHFSQDLFKRVAFLDPASCPVPVSRIGRL